MNAFIRSLSSAQLVILHRNVEFEQNRRIDIKIDLLDYEPVTEGEILLAKTSKLEAIKVYRSRTGATLKFSKRVIDKVCKNG